ncbi:uncharacterized protein N0V89_003912 [Didymosphaeria variabile]|uniref:Zn(2)-C6 fungal-type domain-containing protein n=1 Tax=Didymosphaeria variabile TaxID=1932322 RepID=A0A9W9CCY8_9PLEO|nr:uncharacterized protein N0V89_003912 [Didymosphaeria variabile]KAJ4355887.1 hypothetical protein N0V89_003912 [Didymosphaeria variabile]
MDIDKKGAGGQQLLSFEKGMSDDEHFNVLFGDRFAKSKSCKSPQGKKLSRRLSDQGDGDGATVPSPTKKQRFISLCGGSNSEPDNSEEVPPQTPGISLGMMFSSLDLDQQEGRVDDNDGLPMVAGSNINLETIFDPFETGQSQRLSPVLSDIESVGRHDDVDVPAYIDDPVESYGLRRNINRQGATTTHIDIDQSGNYDPAEETRKKLLKARMARQAKHVQQAKKEKSKKFKGEAEGERKDKFILILKFKAMGSVINITDNQDNWPEGHSIIYTNDEAEEGPRNPRMNLKSQTVRAFASDTVKELLSFVRDDTPIAVSNLHIPDPARQYDDLTAMCDECLEADNLDCKARPPRGYKAKRIDLDRDHYGEDRKWVSCTHCREEKKRCSLKKTADKPPCKRCKKQRIGCHFYDIAPHENDKSAYKETKGKGEELTASEQVKDPKRTLLEEIAPETSIPGSDLFSPEDLAYMDAESSADEEEAAENEPLEEMEDAEGHRGFLTTIKTSFAHPMVFSNHPVGHSNAVIDCNFCEMPIFGMVGHFEREVHVIRWSNGLGYTEFGNGHREGNEATTMCQQCTCDRLQIMVCPDHVIQPIRLQESALDYDAAAENLMSAPPASSQMQHQLQRWCSMCFSLATHQCCTPQPFIGAHEDEEDPVIMNGCGLRFCHRCALEFDLVYQNNLHDMATALDKEPKPKDTEDQDEEETTEAEKSDQGTVRADVGLLMVDGLLMSCVEAGTSE